MIRLLIVLIFGFLLYSVARHLFAGLRPPDDAPQDPKAQSDADSAGQNTHDPDAPADIQAPLVRCDGCGTWIPQPSAIPTRDQKTRNHDHTQENPSEGQARAEKKDHDRSGYFCTSCDREKQKRADT